MLSLVCGIGTICTSELLLLLFINGGEPLDATVVTLLSVDGYHATVLSTSLAQLAPRAVHRPQQQNAAARVSDGTFGTTSLHYTARSC